MCSKKIPLVLTNPIHPFSWSLMTCTLPPRMFGVGCFWLETRTIILATQETLNDFHGDEAIFFMKYSKMADSKKLSFSKPPILNIFLRKFQRLVLGSLG